MITEEQIIKRNEYMREWNKKNKDKKREHDKKYREENREKVREIHKKWRNDNPEHKQKCEEYRLNHIEKFKETQRKSREKRKEYIKAKNKEYKAKNREKINIYQFNKRKNDPMYKLRSNISCLIKNSIQRGKFRKNTKTANILGCDMDFFIDYIKSQFKEGMAIENHGKWHLDHIILISMAKTEEEVIKMNHYTNFQPLWAEENLKKGNKLVLIARGV